MLKQGFAPIFVEGIYAVFSFQHGASFVLTLPSMRARQDYVYSGVLILIYDRPFSLRYTLFVQGCMRSSDFDLRSPIRPGYPLLVQGYEF